ncbi:MAG: lysophospholipid acyltransferase family protein [Anaerolineae bacterium]
MVQHRGLILSNHVSFFDTLVMSYVLPMRYVSKAEVKKWPFIGQIAAATGTMFVNRQDKSKRADVRQQVVEALHHSQYPPIVIFPEGKRNPEDTLLPFRYGVFEIAVETGVPYLLCAIHYEDTESMTWQSHKESLTTSIKRIVLRDPSRVWLTPLKVVQPQRGDDPQQLAAEAREIVGEALRECAARPTHSGHAQIAHASNVTYATGCRSNWPVAVS